MAADHSVCAGVQWEWLVPAVDQVVAAEWPVVILAASAVEAPVFGHAVLGVDFALAGVVLPARALGGYFQHELRRFADLANHVAVAGQDGGRVNAERDQAVGADPAGAVTGVGAQIASAR